MNIKSHNKAWLILFFSFVFTCASFCSEIAWAQSTKDESNQETALSRVRDKLERVQNEIKRHGYRFKARYNPTLKYDIGQLCGLVEPPNWRQNSLFSPPVASLQVLPSSFDWRDYGGGLTPVRDQGNCGSCWAFSVVGSLESQIKIKCGISEDLSEQYLISCIGNEFGYDYSCAKGGWFEAHYYHQWYGAVPESEFPYVARDTACGGPYSHPYQIDSWSYLGDGVPSVESIKQAIYSYGPVSAAMCAGPLFHAYGSGIFNSDEASYCNGGVNHAIVLVGWNDQEGYWILRNSWGSWWGDNGYMKIAYNVSRVGYAANYIEFSTCAEPEVLTSTDVKVAKGNFDNDAAEEFATAELQSDSSVKVSIFDNDGSLVNQFTTNSCSEIALASGNFDGDSQDELVLACVTDAGTLDAQAFEANGTMIGEATGGKCSNVSVATGQFDADSSDEYVVAVVQSDGTLAAFTYNPDGTAVGVGIGGICSHLNIAAGNFDDNPDDDEYVISLLQSDGTLAAITFQGNGDRIGKGVGGLCSNLNVAAGDFMDYNQQDEYVVSLLQADGTLAAISFYANGTRIGKGVGGLCSNVNVASGKFYATDPMDGYVISLNQADDTPAAIFFKADGTRIGKGVGNEIVNVTDIASVDIDNSGQDEAVLAYINQEGYLKWIVFSEDGLNVMSGP